MNNVFMLTLINNIVKNLLNNTPIKNITYREIKLPNGDIKIEKHNNMYTFVLLLMKNGVFGKKATPLSINVYKQLTKIVNYKSNRLFKDDNECNKVLTKFMNDNFFTKEDIDLILHKDLIIKNYPTFNSFFIREIDMSKRPMKYNKNLLNIYSPADCRARFLTSNKSFTVKGNKFHLKDIGFQYNLKHIILCRLIPLDYHHFHAPVSGKIINIKSYHSEFNVSVNEAVIPEFNPYGINARKIITIETKDKHIVEMAIIAATFVDDIVLDVKEGDYIKAGKDIGHFNYGSCVILNLDVKLDKIFRLNEKDEMYLKVREHLGKLA